MILLFLCDYNARRLIIYYSDLIFVKFSLFSPSHAFSTTLPPKYLILNVRNLKYIYLMLQILSIVLKVSFKVSKIWKY